MVKYTINPVAEVPKHVTPNGNFWEVYPRDFPVLKNTTCFILELFDASMRLPHWHPNANELGYLVSGKIEIYMWKYTGAASIYTVSAGQCWFIPMGALHSLNNIGDKSAVMAIGFDNANAQNVDLPVAFNGIPAPIRTAYTSPHAALRDWRGPTVDPFLGDLPEKFRADSDRDLDSPYRIDLGKISPLYDHDKMGNITWAITDNWNILESGNISILRAKLKPNTARDPIWYPDVNTLYVVTNGQARFTIIIANQEPITFEAGEFTYIYVPIGVLHTFVNESKTHDFEAVAFFDKANPQPEVSLALATNFFPAELRDYALTHYFGVEKSGINLLTDLKSYSATPYIIDLDNTDNYIRRYQLFY